MSKIALTWKSETSQEGNVSNVANIKATLKRLSEKEFTYANKHGEELTYKLATVVFADKNGVNHVREGVVCYDTSYSQGMEVGMTYLGKISRSSNADGSARKPWVTLSSLAAGVDFADDDFEDVVVEEPEMSIQ